MTWCDTDVQCRPIDSMQEMKNFMENPPPWHILCKEITPHSTFLIKNSEITKFFDKIALEKPHNYCHIENTSYKMIRRYAEYMLPKTLVVHELFNGYKDDSFIDGTSNFDTYSFYHWAGIDIFCYFSRHLVTIPPVGWINAAHAHGVKVIGTFMTMPKSQFWNNYLVSSKDIEFLINTLVFIAKKYKFEGWLLRFKTTVTYPDLLLDFINKLHTKLHEEIPNCLLIWADAINSDGVIHRERKLTEASKPYFDACDGFFTKCSWNEAELEESIQIAREQLSKLFIGFDIWGTGNNVFGGSMFETQKAVKYAHSYGCSLAIYSPAWTHQAIADPNDCQDDPNVIYKGESLTKNDSFLLRDRALWTSLWPFFNTRVPSTLPFQTFFCQGRGIKRRMYGEVLCNVPWYNLRHMQYQPNSTYGEHGYLLGMDDKIKKTFQTLTKVRGGYNIRQAFHEEGSVILQESKQFPEILPKNGNIETRYSTTTLISEDLTTPSQKPKTTLRGKIVQSFNTVFKRSKYDVKCKNEEISVKSLELKEYETRRVDTDESLLLERRRSSRILGGFPYMCLAYLSAERQCLEPFYQDSLNGGCCLKIHPSDQISSRHRTIRLFHTDFAIEDTVLVCFVAKTLAGFGTQYLTVILEVLDEVSPSIALREVVLIGRHNPIPDGTSTKNCISLYPIHPTQPEYKKLEAYLILEQPTFSFPRKNTFGWLVFYFVVSLPKMRVTCINLRTGLFTGSVLLGFFGMAPIPKAIFQPLSYKLPRHEKTALGGPLVADFFVTTS